DEHDTEHVVGEVVDTDRPAERGTGADHEADLDLDIEPLRGPEGIRSELPARPAHRSAGDDDRPRATVIADWQVVPVGQQRRLPWPQQPADVARVMLRRIEVDVVADRDRQ